MGLAYHWRCGRCAAWIAVLDACGSGNNSPMGIILVIVDWEWRRKKYRDFLVNIKKPHCYENVTAKLKSWNHTCLVRPYRSVYKLMWSNELRLREYVKLNTQCQWKHNSKIYWRMSFCPDISINTVIPQTPVIYLYFSPSV